MDRTESQFGGDAKPLVQERRRAVRQKVHIPAYASFNEGSAALDLSEILDISESGVAIRTANALEVNRDFKLFLDLSEAESPIEASASVAWTDPAGRAGIRLAELPKGSRRQLQEWLEHNALAACPGPDEERIVDPVGLESDLRAPAEPESTLLPDYSSVLFALSAVAREVESFGPDLDAALLLIASRTAVFTGATGVAIAFSEGQELICHSAVGEDAPPPGTRLAVGSGFSGECLRTGMLLRCDDTETDSRVDREVCRALGIRSMAAVPIRLAGKVIGIVEIFSSSPHAFSPNEDTILQRLAEIIVAAVNRAARAHVAWRNEGAATDSESSADAKSTQPFAAMVSDAESSMHRYQKALLIAVGLTILLVLVFLLSPRTPVQSLRRGSDFKARAAPPPTPAKVIVPRTVAEATTLDDLRLLAEQGDAYAQFAIGARYATGDGLKQDYSQAVVWFTKAAQQGHVVAQATLGAYYWAGRGVPQDLSQAYFWSILARAGGDEASKYRVAVLTSRMSHAQVVTAQQRADEWIGSHQVAKKQSFLP